MPIKKSAIKELRKSKKRAIINANKKQTIKNLIKKIKKAIDNSKIDDAKKLALDTVKLLDKAEKKHLIHKNTAARKKSRVYKAIKKASTKK